MRTIGTSRNFPPCSQALLGNTIPRSSASHFVRGSRASGNHVTKQSLVARKTQSWFGGRCPRLHSRLAAPASQSTDDRADERCCEEQTDSKTRQRPGNRQRAKDDCATDDEDQPREHDCVERIRKARLCKIDGNRPCGEPCDRRQQSNRPAVAHSVPPVRSLLLPPCPKLCLGTQFLEVPSCDSSREAELPEIT